jgi:hypothetical protein
VHVGILPAAELFDGLTRLLAILILAIAGVWQRLVS